MKKLAFAALFSVLNAPVFATSGGGDKSNSPNEGTTNQSYNKGTVTHNVSFDTSKEHLFQEPLKGEFSLLGCAKNLPNNEYTCFSVKVSQDELKNYYNNLKIVAANSMSFLLHNYGMLNASIDLQGVAFSYTLSLDKSSSEYTGENTYFRYSHQLKKIN